MTLGADIAHFIHQQLRNIGINIDYLFSELLVSILIFIFFIFIGWIVYTVFEQYLVGFAHKTKTKLDDEILKNIKKPIYAFVFIFGARYAVEFLSFLQENTDMINIMFYFAEVFLVTFIITRVINVLLAWYAEKRKTEQMSEHFIYVLRKIINGLVVLFSFLFILWIFNIDLSGAVVGLGVGGIIIGFALQSVLIDFFSAFSIYFDRPFEIGDFIVIGDYSGTVTKITMKSTRIKLLQGEELVISNKDLTSSSVRNFKKMRRRRISFSFGVTYDTDTEKLKKIPEIIKKIIDPKKLKDIDSLDRVHFSEFGDFSLKFDIVYYMRVQDYTRYKDTQQLINFAIREEFEKEGIQMAFPTQTVYLAKNAT
ncbi:MAG: mechanosensitive ion channel family protein [Candidatus Thermoplasmatota archaeon]|nr:mechanosensitive ion channel family protein [Candidatus Thermoplasmatota archaeon]MBU1940738.1 mechanosensitive ion channel family protein [Candidatus Thermoplasmatota archaeon]